MKKRIAISILLASTLIFAGCGKNETTQTNSSAVSVSEENTELSAETEEVTEEAAATNTSAWETSDENARIAFAAWLADIANAKEWSETATLDSLSFIAADFNDTPVLFVKNEEGTHHDSVRMYVYLEDGTVKQLFATETLEAYPLDDVFALSNTGMDEEVTEYYQLTESGSYPLVATSTVKYAVADGDTDAGSTYTLQDGECTESEFNAYIAELTAHKSETGSIESVYLKNTEENRKSYFKLESSEFTNSTLSDTSTSTATTSISSDSAIADGTYYPFFIGSKDRTEISSIESSDAVFSWLSIGSDSMQITMDLGNGMQTYDIPLASGVKYIESAEDDWEISADQLNSSYGASGTLYGFNISLTISGGQVQEICTFS